MSGRTTSNNQSTVALFVSRCRQSLHSSLFLLCPPSLLRTPSLSFSFFVFLFSFAGALTLDEVKDAMGTDIEVAKRALHSLSCGKYKLLLKSPESNSIGANDSFRYNAKFSCPLRKVRVPMASLEELGANKKNIDEDRSLAIEAAIVRIMKARKTLAHAQLVTECIAQLHFFKPQAKDIKKRIEHLIQRDYLERDDADSNIYNYLA